MSAVATSSSVGTDALGTSQSLTAGMTGSNELGKEEFLLLLVTQLQYQDPLDPMDDKEFIAQLAQFTALEQQMNMSASMDELVQVQLQQQMISAASYIGREVAARGYGVSVESTGDGIEDVKISKLEYSVAETMASGYANIFDSNNQLVKTITLPSQAAGIHELMWDGTRTNGSKAPNGVYTVQIAAKNEAGETIMTDTSVAGLVDGVTMSDGEQILRLSDGRIVALSNVREVLAFQEETTVNPEGDEDSSADESTSTEETDTDNTTSGDTESDTADSGTSTIADNITDGAQAVADLVNTPTEAVAQTQSMASPIQEQISEVVAEGFSDQASVSQLYKSSY